MFALTGWLTPVTTLRLGFLAHTMGRTVVLAPWNVCEAPLGSFT